MKKILPFFIVLMILVGCKKELVKEPKRLIEREKMVNIMYDLSLLQAMRTESPTLLDSFKNNSNQYIFKKYKIDSLQFAQSNIYYAADYKEYVTMYNQVKARLEKEKAKLDSWTKAKAKKEMLKAKNKKKLQAKKVADSIKKVKIEESNKEKKVIEKAKLDSIKKAKSVVSKIKVSASKKKIQ